MAEKERGRLTPATLAELQAVDVGLLPEELFIELARLTVLPAVEVVCLRRGSVGVEVLLTQRVEFDPFWPGQWHVPGSVLRPTDAAGSMTSALTRVLAGELGLSAWSEPVFVSPIFWHNIRGAALSLVYYVNVDHLVLPVGEFFPITELPKNRVVDMDGVIVMAANAYAARIKV